jgi:hypothetical protein
MRVAVARGMNLRPCVFALLAFPLLVGYARDARADESSKPAERSSEDRRSRTTQSHTLMTAGAVAFSVSYLPALAAGAPSLGINVAKVFGGLYCLSHDPDRAFCAEKHQAAALVLPIFGPAYYATKNADGRRDPVLNPNGNLSALGRGLLWTSAIVQTVGIGLMVAGMVTGGSTKEPRRDEARVRFAPMLGPSGYGLSVEASGW